jgi:hypothetical protein
MVAHEDETERYLKEFQPRAIRGLEVAPTIPHMLWGRMAAAAILVLLAAGGFWFAHFGTGQPSGTANLQPSDAEVIGYRQYPSVLALTVLASTDSKKFEVLLTEESRKSLPNFSEEHSTLKVLAKE